MWLPKVMWIGKPKKKHPGFDYCPECGAINLYVEETFCRNCMTGWDMRQRIMFLDGSKWEFDGWDVWGGK